DEGDDPAEAAALDPREAPEAEDDAVFVLVDDPDAGKKEEKQDTEGDEQSHSRSAHEAFSTSRVRPSTRRTTTSSPSAIGCSERAFHRSPKTKTVPLRESMGESARPFFPIRPRSPTWCWRFRVWAARTRR